MLTLQRKSRGACVAFDDKERGRVFPTRFGPPQGAQREREMLGVVGGAGGIRQKMAQNPGGSTTRLVTRDGQPRFITTGGGQEAAPCLRGPLEEKTAQFARRRWHDPLPDMVSSDGIFRIPRAPLRKIAVMAGEDPPGPLKLVEMHFASPSIGAQLTAPDALALPILESAYGDRLWHPRQMGRIALGLYFCMSRLRKLSLLCQKTNGKVPFAWWMSKESDPDMAGSLPICMNREAQETGLGTRLLHGLSQIKQFSLKVKTRVGAVITASPGGFLGGLDSPPVDGEVEFPAIVSDAGQVLNNLSTAHSCGQPWHGWLTAEGIETHTDPVNFPLGRVVKPSGYVGPESGDTFYFAIPWLPDVSEAVTDTFAYDGMSYLKDVVFFSHTKRYSPLGDGFELGPARWLHYNPGNGKVSVLRLEVVGGVNRDYANLKVHVDGVLTIRGVVGASREIGSFNITSPHTWVLPTTTGSHGNPAWYRNDTPENYWKAFVSSQRFADVGILYLFPLNTSPTGDRAIVSHYRATKKFSTMFDYQWTPPDITSAWEIVVQDDLSSASISVAWEVDVSNITGGTTSYYWEELYLNEIIPGYFVQYIPGFPPIYTDGHRWNWRGVKFDVAPTRTPFRVLLMAGYSSEGALVLTEGVYSYELDTSELQWPESTEGVHVPADFGGPHTVGHVADGVVFPDPNGWLWNPNYNRLHVTSPSFDWVGKALVAPYLPPVWASVLPEIVVYSNNVVMLRDMESSSSFRSELIATEATAPAAPFGYVGLAGFASYNPRTKEIRWAAGKIGCV